MKRRSKLWWLAGAVIFVMVLVLSVYLALVPSLPTGYEKIEAQWAADQQALGPDSAPTAVPAAATGRTIETARVNPAPADAVTTGPLVKITAAPTTGTQAGETPRRAFERCWAALADAARWHRAKDGTVNSPELGPFVVGSLANYGRSGTNNASLVPSCGNLEASLSVDELRALDRLERGSPPWLTLLREYCKKEFDDRFAKQTGVTRQDIIPVSMPVRPVTSRKSALIDAIPRMVPPPYLMELLRLPDGAVPFYPSENVRASLGKNNNIAWSDFSSLCLAPMQAYLYLLATDPGYDAAAGLRRVPELYRYAWLCAYPDNNYLSGDILYGLGCLLSSAAEGDALSSASLRSLSAEFLRLADTGTTQRTEQAGRVRRYEAALTRQALLRDLDAILLSKNTINTNTFSYLFNGQAGSWWFRANAKLLRYRIDQLAVALAQDGRPDVESAAAELQRAMTIANWNNTARGYYATDLEKDNDNTRILRDSAVGLATHAYRRANDRLPEQVADLFPDYLSESARPVIDRDIWLFQPKDGQTVLWRVDYFKLSENEYKRIFSEKAMQQLKQRQEESVSHPFNNEDLARWDQSVAAARKKWAGGARLSATAVAVF